MPRRQTLFVPGCFYHLYNRGNNRQAIFFEPDNYLYFLRGVHRYLTPVLDILAYCLMPTHYHLLVRVREAKASEVLETSEVSSAISKAMMRLAFPTPKPSTSASTASARSFRAHFRPNSSQPTRTCATCASTSTPIR